MFDHRADRDRDGPLAADADRAPHRRALGPRPRHGEEIMSGAAPADAGLGREKSSRLLLDRDGRKILIGIVLIVLVVFGQKLYGMATAASRLDPALRHAAAPRNSHE